MATAQIRGPSWLGARGRDRGNGRQSTAAKRFFQHFDALAMPHLAFAVFLKAGLVAVSFRHQNLPELARGIDPRRSTALSTSAIVAGGAPRHTIDITAGGTAHPANHSVALLAVTSAPSSTARPASAAHTAIQSPSATPRVIGIRILSALFRLAGRARASSRAHRGIRGTLDTSEYTNVHPDALCTIEQFARRRVCDDESGGLDVTERVVPQVPTLRKVWCGCVLLVQVVLVALCFPLAIVLVGLPVVLVVRLVLEIVKRL